MPNIAKLLKDEIERLARKEVKTAVTPLIREKIEMKKAISDLKKRVDILEKGNKKLAKVAGVEKLPGEPAPEGEKRVWITSKGIKRLRAKMKLSQLDFAKLLGVSGQAVTNWEGADGKLNLRRSTLQSIQEVRGFGAKAARKRLDEMDVEPTPAAV